MDPIFTVFTPTFNRAHTLHRTFESLRDQTCQRFEWLVVDDGSTDGTKALIEGWKGDAAFPVRYLAQEHLGAHVASNLGVKEARGRFFTKLDSDDKCVPSALERLLWHWDQIPHDEREGFSSVTGLCQDQDGALVGDRFPHDVLDSDPLELRYRYKIGGEKWGFVRTDVLREFRFPDGVQGNFIPESVLWSQIARRYRTRFINEILRIYWMDAPSLVHGPRDHAVNAEGHRLMFLTMLNDELDWLYSSPAVFLRAAANYSRFSFHAGVSVVRQYRSLRSFQARVLWGAGLPAGVLAFWRDRARRGDVVAGIRPLIVTL